MALGFLVPGANHNISGTVDISYLSTLHNSLAQLSEAVFFRKSKARGGGGAVDLASVLFIRLKPLPPYTFGALSCRGHIRLN